MKIMKAKFLSIVALAAMILSFAACSGNDPEVTPAYVDLGLPSGTLWKNVNEPKTDTQYGYYSFRTAKEKFGDNLPSTTQWKELKDNCEWTWKGNGYEVSGNGNKIFLPAEGRADYDLGEWTLVTDEGGYWASDDMGSAAGAVVFTATKGLSVWYVSPNNQMSVRLIKK